MCGCQATSPIFSHFIFFIQSWILKRAQMGSEYDENLEENSFFKHIRLSYDDILKTASENNWIICVPRSGSLNDDKVTNGTVLQHVLRKSSDSSLYYNLSSKEVNKHNSTLTLKTGNVTNTSRILFVEEFHVGKDKFIVWCIDGPLDSDCNSNIGDVVEIDNLRDCIDFLWKDKLGYAILEKISGVVRTFLSQNNLSQLKLQQQVTCVKMLYEDCYKLACNDDSLLSKSTDQNALMNIRLSVETYMQTRLSSKLFNAVGLKVAYMDANFNKVIRNIQDVPLKFFEIDQEFCNSLPLAKLELSKINRTHTTFDKISCLRRTFDILSTQGIRKDALSAENLLQIFVFLIIKCNVCNWVTNFVFVKQFRFSVKNSCDQNDFLIATLQAAIEHIRKGDLIEKYAEFESSIVADGHDLNALFRCIQKGNVKDVVQILRHKTSEADVKLCHPLCSCDMCEKLLIETNNCNVNSCDATGRTPLHVACKYVNGDVVEFLIHNGAEINRADCSGYTPLHYAVSKGHQHAALLLLNAKCDVHNPDCEGNTPLHVAVRNGHKNCVNALIYLKSDCINLDDANNSGDTPLHFASKFGYINIVDILIQHGAKITRNLRNLTPMDVALNDCIRQLLSSVKRVDDDVVSKIKPIKVASNEFHGKTTPSPTKLRRSVSFNFEHDFHNQRSFVNFGVRPKDASQLKKIDLLVKAIENNDLQLTCFYLGIPSPNVTVSFHPKCHPLCTCDDCSEESPEDAKEPTRADNLNINICNVDGYTPIHIAASRGKTDILRLLLDAGALINLKTYKTFYTPLHLACLKRHVSIVRELLKCGNCKIDALDSKGNTSIHYACLNNDARTFELLLSQGADVTVQNNDGKTVLNVAEEKFFHNIVKLLKHAKYFDTSNFEIV